MSDLLIFMIKLVVFLIVAVFAVGAATMVAQRSSNKRVSAASNKIGIGAGIAVLVILFIIF